MMTSPWSEAEGRLLQDLRRQAGLDQATLARRCTLSVAQLAELEEGGSGRFYGEGIKAHTGRGILRRLGHAPAPAPEQALAPTVATPPAPPLAVPPRPVAAFPAPRRAAPVRRGLVALGGLAGLAVAAAVAAPFLPDSLRPGALAGAPTALAAAVKVAFAAPTAPAPSPAAAEPAPPPAVPAAPAEPAAVAAPPAAPAVPSTAAMAGEAAPADPACDAAPSGAPEFTPPRPLRPASYVYVESTRPAVLCVRDGGNRQMATEVKPGEGVTVSGTAPFVVHTRQWDDLRVFFQGVRVNVAAAAPQVVVLNAR